MYAVAPLTPALLDLLVNLRAIDPMHVPGLCDRLADHWCFRRAGRTLITTGTGMHVLTLHLTPEEAEPVRAALAGAGLDPDLLQADE